MKWDVHGGSNTSITSPAHHQHHITSASIAVSGSAGFCGSKLKTHKFCVHCAEAGSTPLLCVAGSDASTCSTTETTVQACKDMKPKGDLIGQCFSIVMDGTKDVGFYDVPLLEEASSFAAASAINCPTVPACTDPSMASNRYCVSCSPSGGTPLSCIADPGKPCWTPYKVSSVRWTDLCSPMNGNHLD